MSDQEALEALRRRVYGPSASDADRQAYAALLERMSAEQEPPAPDETAPEPTEASALTAPAPRRSRWPIVLGAAGVLLVLGLGTISTAIARTSTTSPPPTRRAAQPWSGTARPTPGPLLMPATITLRHGPIAGQATSGSGSAVMPLDLSGAPPTGGTLIVSLVSSDPAPIGWVAERHRECSHDDAALETVALEGPALRDGSVAPTVVRYSGAPPAQLTVRAPIGTGWALTVAFTQ